MGREFYLEIGSEELPTGYILPALEAMSVQMTRFLDDHRVAHGAPRTFGTPRRLCLWLPEVADHQESRSVEIIGPPRNAAFDAEGRPTKAAQGFAKSQGLAVEDLQVKSTPKGEYICVVREETGLPTRELLEQMLPDFIAHIPFPKSMRWGSLAVTFARPIHWIVALLGSEVLRFRYGDVDSGDRSFGHRFMSPEWITVKDPAAHKENLRRHSVVLDHRERREMIRRGVEETAAKVGGTVVEDEDLLDEVTQLVEYPFPLLGEFEAKYLELPPEVPITVMKEHQRYFAVKGADGRLLPHFVTVANTIPRNAALVAAGNARVIRARLEDARFYYEEDLKISLEARAQQLKDVVFHSKLGTSWEKMERFSALARWLGERLAPDRLDVLFRAAHLCKADLVSGMVGEFPELQGVMGRAYAKLQGEPEAVAEAIYEHYLPIRAGGPIPQRLEGALLSIADKIDTIVGCFGVGLLPTGAADPFALRRQTLGIIRIVLEKGLRVSLADLIDRAIPLLGGKMTEPPQAVKDGVLEFFKGRLQHHLVSQYGFPADIVEAVLATGFDDMVDVVARARALAAFRRRPDFESLAVAFKRVANIVKEPEAVPVAADLFREDAERTLHDRFLKAEDAVRSSLAAANYDAALETMAQLRESIDRFFDAVLVMDKDENIRRNRLALLSRISELFSNVADFRKVQTA